jgi:CTP-dependent riboflavin kinase
VIGDIADDIVVGGGMIISDLGDGRVYVDIPFSPETIPT